MKKIKSTRYRSRFKHTPGSGVILGTATGMILIFSVVTVISILIQKEFIKMENTNIILKLFFGITVLFCSYLTAKKAQKAKLIQAFIPGILLLCVLFPSTLNGREGESLHSSVFWITVCACLIGGFFGSKQRRSGYV